jgi:hypothetical protein
MNAYSLLMEHCLRKYDQWKCDADTYAEFAFFLGGRSKRAGISFLALFLPRLARAVSHDPRVKP